MSRFCIQLHYLDLIDSDAAIGYDKPLRTFFLQGFINQDEADDKPEIWLGAFLEEYPTLESLAEEARQRGYEVHNLKNTDMIAMLCEAGLKPEPSLAEILGMVK